MLSSGLHFANHASELCTFRWRRANEIASRSDRRLLALAFSDLFRDGPILRNPGNSPFCRGHQVKWFVHWYAFFHHLATIRVAHLLPRFARLP
jgi:hypothetical protein